MANLSRRSFLGGMSAMSGAALAEGALGAAPPRSARARPQDTPGSELNMESWLVMPDEVGPKILEWQERHPQLVHVDHVEQFCGRKTYAVSVSDRSVPDAGKKKHIFSQPHAHEPAPTAACMNVINQLLEGRDLDGNPTEWDVDAVLTKTVLSFIPDGNPDGRARSPEPYWDGSKWTNEDFWKWMRGIDAETGERFKRVDKWSTREDHPKRIGIVYEQINEHEYVEPNRSWDSSFFRLIHMLLERHDYDQLLDLHQTEFPNSPNNCMIILPVLQDELPEKIREANAAWAQETVDAWTDAGGRPRPEPRPLSYTGEQRQYFVERWGHIYRKMSKLTSEVQNNNVATPPVEQRRLTEIAIRVGAERLLS
jgi:hypothetical protein